MERLIVQLNSNSKIVYDKGRFDDWCVYIVEGTNKVAPKDIETFMEIKKLSGKYSNEKIYEVFLAIYRHTYSAIDLKVIEIIKNMALSFQPEDRLTIERWFVVIYASMIAENKKENTKLGKRIKHLGLYQILFKNYTPEQAANFSKGKSWIELDKIMNTYGI